MGKDGLAHPAREGSLILNSRRVWAGRTRCRASDVHTYDIHDDDDLGASFCSNEL